MVNEAADCWFPLSNESTDNQRRQVSNGEDYVNDAAANYLSNLIDSSFLDVKHIESFIERQICNYTEVPDKWKLSL
jgi:hypothetical protein